MSRTIEKLHPRAAGLSAVLIWFVLNWFDFGPEFESFINKAHPHLLLGTITFGSIMAGFFGVSVSVLFVSSELMSAVKKSPYYALLVDYIAEFIYSAVFLTLASLSFLFVLYIPCIAKDDMFPIVFIGVWLGLMVWTVLCLFRLIRVITGIIKIY